MGASGAPPLRRGGYATDDASVQHILWHTWQNGNALRLRITEFDHNGMLPIHPLTEVVIMRSACWSLHWHKHVVEGMRTGVGGRSKGYKHISRSETIEDYKMSPCQVFLATQPSFTAVYVSCTQIGTHSPGYSASSAAATDIFTTSLQYKTYFNYKHTRLHDGMGTSSMLEAVKKKPMQ